MGIYEDTRHWERQHRSDTGCKRRLVSLVGVLVLLVILMCQTGVSRADVATMGQLREVSLGTHAAPGEVTPLVTTISEDYECTAKYSDVQSGAFSWVIGNCPKGTTLEAVILRLHSDSEPAGDYALGGFVGGEFQGCGWIEEDRFKPKALKSKPTTTCSEIASGSYEIPESHFMAAHNGGVGDGYWVVNPAPCPEYANYRPWSTSNVEQGYIRTQPAYATSSGNVPALKWRYTTKYKSTDGTGTYVMVHDATIADGEGNWVFVPRSCLPTALPENESERVPSAPSVITGSATETTPSTAVLNGTVNPNGLPTKFHFDYGTSLSYGASTAEYSAGAGTGSVPEAVGISGLAAATTYYFRIVATSATGTTFGGPVSFETPGAPTVTTQTASEVIATQAHIKAAVIPNGADTHYHFEYGKTPSYGSSTGELDAGSGWSEVRASVPVTGLEPGTTYHYRIVATNVYGGPIYGVDSEFTTPLPPNGSYYRVANGVNQGEVLEAAGAALIPVRECSGEVTGCSSGWAEVSSAVVLEYEAAHPTISGGTFVRVGDGANQGEVSEAAGGALIAATECTGELKGCTWINVDSKGLSEYATAHPTISGGTFVRVGDGANQGEVSEAAGGALINVTECAGELHCSWVNVDSKGLAAYRTAHPTISGGTFVRVGDGANQGEVSEAAGGALIAATECTGELKGCTWINVDSKGLAAYRAAHLTISNGTFVRVGDGSNQGEITDAAGGALINVTECAGELHCSSVSVDSKGLAAYRTAHPTISSGTMVRVADGNNAGELGIAAGGAVIGVTECAAELHCTNWVNVDSKGLSSYKAAHATISNGTFVRVADGANAGEVLIAAGAAALEVNECALLNGCSGWINVDSKGIGSYEAAHPTIANGTYLLGLPSKKTWLIENGKRKEIGANEASISVTDVMVERIPSG